MVAPMVYTLIAAHLPLNRRARAIGWLFSGEALAATVGTPIIGIIAEAGGWRLAYLGFVLPIALISLVLTAKEVPSSPRNPIPQGTMDILWKGLKRSSQTTQR